MYHAHSTQPNQQSPNERECRRRSSVKTYDKQGTVLRLETTLNDMRGLKVFRRRAEEPQGKREWLPLRKGVANMSCRAQLSHSANRRYLEALSKIDAHTPLSRVADKLCQPAWDERGRRDRALNPLASEDAQLLESEMPSSTTAR